MDITQSPVYPVSQARSIFGKLIDQTEKDKTVLLTKKGRIKVALVNFEYLKQLKKDLDAIYKKTYINKALLPFTRNFSDQEISEWLKEDQL